MRLLVILTLLCLVQSWDRDSRCDRRNLRYETDSLEEEAKDQELDEDVMFEEDEDVMSEEDEDVMSEEDEDVMFEEDEDFMFEEGEDVMLEEDEDVMFEEDEDGMFEEEDDFAMDQYLFNGTGNHTVSRKLGGLRFNLKLHWRRGHCWEDEWEERKWCMECAGSGCGSGDRLELQKCKKKNNQKFTWDSGRLKVYNKNLCLERTSSNGFKLKSCSGTSKQKFNGFKRNSPFELKPKGKSSNCITPDDPKSGEVIKTTSCSKARRANTNKWEVYWASGSGGGSSSSSSDDSSDDDHKKRLRNGNCSGNHKCDKCEGDCDRDGHCKGSLKCFKRGSSNPFKDVPGCRGRGDREKDYCYDKEDKY